MGRYELEPDKEMDRRDRGRRMKSPPLPPPPMDSRSRRRDSPGMMMQSRPPPMPRDSYDEPYMRPKPEREHVAYKILCVGTNRFLFHFLLCVCGREINR
jgi:hypothetical protein